MSQVIEVEAKLTNEILLDKVIARLGCIRKDNNILLKGGGIITIKKDKIIYDNMYQYKVDKLLNEYLKEEVLYNVSLYGGNVLSIEDVQDGIDIEVEVADEN